MKQTPIKKFSHKIALVFALSSTILALTSIYLIILMVNRYIDQSVKLVLRSSIEELSTDFQAQQLESKNVSFLRNRLTESKSYDEAVQNVADVKTQLDQKSAKDKKEATAEDELETLGEAQGVGGTDQMELLKQSNQVYSRVFLPNGDILFSSDLFDRFSFIDPDKLGFRKLQDDQVCLYVGTVRLTSGPQAGSIVQTGQYCSFNQQQQQELWLYALAAASLMSLFSYFLGRKLSAWIIRPLYQLYQRTLRFSRQVYHELLTPITVALSSAESAIKTENYQDGLSSVTKDLQQVQHSLHALSQQISLKQDQFKQEKFDLSQLLPVIWQDLKKSYNRPDLNLVLPKKTKVIIRARKSAVRLVLRNIISNVLRHTPKNGQVRLELNTERLKIENDRLPPDQMSTNTGRFHGVGLTVVEDLCENLGWSFRFSKREDSFRVVVQFFQ